jgi:fibronectin type 3 domain-containing protein
VQSFIRHNFVARWQDKQTTLAMNRLDSDAILSHIDYAENYTFQVQDEIQSEYFLSVSVTILVHITYRKVLNLDTGDEKL